VRDFQTRLLEKIIFEKAPGAELVCAQSFTAPTLIDPTVIQSGDSAIVPLPYLWRILGPSLKRLCELTADSFEAEYDDADARLGAFAIPRALPRDRERQAREQLAHAG
jgi:hypothetical protein